MDLIQQLLELFKGFAQMDDVSKAAVVVMALIAIWKSSFVAPYWDKLGKLQILVAPVLGLLLAILQLPGFTFAQALPMIWIGIKTGALAMGFHLVLKALEEAPWVGEKYKKWLAFVDTMFFKPKLPQAKKK